MDAVEQPLRTTALMMAAAHGRVGIVRRLVGCGARLELRDSCGMTRLCTTPPPRTAAVEH